MRKSPTPITVAQLVAQRGVSTATVVLRYLASNPQRDGVFSLVSGDTFRLVIEAELDEPNVNAQPVLA